MIIYCYCDFNANGVVVIRLRVKEKEIGVVLLRSCTGSIFWLLEAGFAEGDLDAGLGLGKGRGACNWEIRETRKWEGQDRVLNMELWLEGAFVLTDEKANFLVLLSEEF